MIDPFPAPFTLANLATAFIAMNFLAFAAFGIDKAKAEAGRRRISEGTLLMLALLGGSPGAYAGRAAFRHKTRKQPFSSELARRSAGWRWAERHAPFPGAGHSEEQGGDGPRVLTRPPK
jgi:uncharacterized membrane protein YsdA (DUF1294 family)